MRFFPAFKQQLLIPALLLSLYVAQCLWFVGTQSACCDEGSHLSSGVMIWRYGIFTHINDHPPLERMWASMLLAATHTVVPAESPAQLESGAPRSDLNPERTTHLARPLVVLLGVALGCLLWTNCRRWFSDGAANFALALFALSPDLIGHYSVASTDGAGALSVFLLAVCLARWWSLPTLRSTLWLGMASGIALVAKFYTLPLVMLVFAIVLLKGLPSSTVRFWKWDWRSFSTTAAIAIMVVWAVYFFHVGTLSISDHGVYVPQMDSRSLWHFPFPGHVSFPVPAPEFVAGVAQVSWHNNVGHPAFLLGRIAWHGFLLYYPLAMILKWPIIIIGLAIAGTWLIWRKRTGPPAIFFLLPLVFLSMAVLIGHIQIGIRHLLPVYPFLLVLAAAVWEAAVTRKAKLFLIALLSLQAVDIARYAPNQISYFNFFVPERSVYKIITDSNVNWGQGMLAVRKYQQEHPEEILYIAGYNFERYGIRAVRLHPGEHVSGTVIIPPTELSGQLEKDPNAYRWLLRYPIKTVLDHALYVFQVPKEEAQ
jgi:hypothetical protein